VHVLSERTFFRIRDKLLYPVVHGAWLEEKRRTEDELQADEDVCLIGDGRGDSAGYSAKYSTYTLMHSSPN